MTYEIENFYFDFDADLYKDDMGIFSMEITGDANYHIRVFTANGDTFNKDIYAPSYDELVKNIKIIFSTKEYNDWKTRVLNNMYGKLPKSPLPIPKPKKVKELMDKAKEAEISYLEKKTEKLEEKTKKLEERVEILEDSVEDLQEWRHG